MSTLPRFDKDTIKLEPEDAKLRFEVLQFAIDYLGEQSNIEVNLLTPHEQSTFLNEFATIESGDPKKANALLTQSRYEDLIAEYDIERLYALWQFSEYCSWIPYEDIPKHFGSVGMAVFYALIGKPPEWFSGSIPYVMLLRAVWYRIMREYRNNTIDEYIKDHYEDVNRFFTDSMASPLKTMPNDEKGLIQVFHVYSRLRKKWSEDEKAARKWMREHPEEVARIREKHKNDL